MIIKSLLDTDFYKLSMMNAAFVNFPQARARYDFICRTPDADFTRCYEEIKQAITDLGVLRFSPDDIHYLSSLGYFQSSFFEALSTYKLPVDRVSAHLESGRLNLTVYGPWWQTILFEVPLLAIVNECYFRHRLQSLQKDVRDHTIQEGVRRLEAKRDLILGAPDNFKLVEFGTRRRFSRLWQETVLLRLLECNVGERKPIIGTSNVELARKHGVQPMGTMAHEWIQAFQALAPLRESQIRAFEIWMMTYRGSLDVALTDCIGFSAFERDFDLLLAKAYDGVRHDSGDPYHWCEGILNIYRYFGIDPMTKTAMFSDGLDVHKAIRLSRYYNGRINTMFGIGTNLTNDLGLEPLNIVMKMTECNGQPVAKISDEPGKAVCSRPSYLQHLKDTFGIWR